MLISKQDTIKHTIKVLYSEEKYFKKIFNGIIIAGYNEISTSMK